MRWEKVIIPLIVTIMMIMVVQVKGYGEPVNDRPNYQDRAAHVFINAARVDPAKYKTLYMAGYASNVDSILVNYPAVAPIYIDNDLTSAAVFHSTDMAQNAYFDHNNKDGSSWSARIASYYKCGSAGENIAAGGSTALDTNNQFLCDGSNGVCAADKGGADGHRANIMNSVYKVVGCGYYYLSTAPYRHYWTQDLGTARCLTATPIYGGSHYFPSSTQIKFMATYAGSSVSNPTVVIDGTSYALTLEMGSETAGGHYVYTGARGTGCRNYYFMFGNYRYPDTGCLVTFGDVSACTTSYASTCPGSSNPTTVAPVTPAPTSTSKPATTPAPTNKPATTPAPTNKPATNAPSTTSKSTSSPTVTPTPRPTAPPKNVTVTTKVTFSISVANVSAVNTTSLKAAFASVLKIDAADIEIILVPRNRTRAVEYDVVLVIKTEAPPTSNITALSLVTLQTVQTSLTDSTSPVKSTLDSSNVSVTSSAVVTEVSAETPTNAPVTSSNDDNSAGNKVNAMGSLLVAFIVVACYYL